MSKTITRRVTPGEKYDRVRYTLKGEMTYWETAVVDRGGDPTHWENLTDRERQYMDGAAVAMVTTMVRMYDEWQRKVGHEPV
jgi:ribonucleotide reductase beta subunit family protein with ferritin-like domain